MYACAMLVKRLLVACASVSFNRIRYVVINLYNAFVLCINIVLFWECKQNSMLFGLRMCVYVRCQYIIFFAPTVDLTFVFLYMPLRKSALFLVAQCWYYVHCKAIMHLDYTYTNVLL